MIAKRHKYLKPGICVEMYSCIHQQGTWIGFIKWWAQSSIESLASLFYILYKQVCPNSFLQSTSPKLENLQVLKINKFIWIAHLCYVTKLATNWSCFIREILASGSWEFREKERERKCVLYLCVCVRERERESAIVSGRERESEFVPSFFMLGFRTKTNNINNSFVRTRRAKSWFEIFFTDSKLLLLNQFSSCSNVKQWMND